MAKQKYGRRVSGKKGTCDRRIVKREMSLWKKGKLKSGSGVKVKSQRQAVAIALSVARRKCSRSRRRSRH